MKKILPLFCTAIIFLFLLCLLSLGHTSELPVTFPAELTGDTLYQQGIDLCNQEKYIETIAPLEEAIKRKANFADAYYQLGVCYLKTKQFDKAKQNLIFAKTLSSNKELTNKAASLIATIPAEIEKEKKLQEAAELKKRNEEYANKVKQEEKATKKQAPEKNETNIFDAAVAGDVAKVKALLEKNPGLVNAKDNRGLTPLHLAAMYGRKDVAEVLLANKANIEAKANDSGGTPLHWAVFNDRKDVVKLLLANKAD
ncbi:MAG: ankyrin repeat domain-containing protein, partial [Candidatus Ratteibacteria bacterium]